MMQAWLFFSKIAVLEHSKLLLPDLNDSTKDWQEIRRGNVEATRPTGLLIWTKENLGKDLRFLSSTSHTTPHQFPLLLEVIPEPRSGNFLTNLLSKTSFYARKTTLPSCQINLLFYFGYPELMADSLKLKIMYNVSLCTILVISIRFDGYKD